VLCPLRGSLHSRVEKITGRAPVARPAMNDKPPEPKVRTQYWWVKVGPHPECALVQFNEDQFQIRRVGESEPLSFPTNKKDDVLLEPLIPAGGRARISKIMEVVSKVDSRWEETSQIIERTFDRMSASADKLKGVARDPTSIAGTEMGSTFPGAGTGAGDWPVRQEATVKMFDWSVRSLPRY
jgi:hypothetical protein